MSKKKFIKSFLGILFLILSFYSAYQLRDQSGFNFFIFLVLICVFTDLGGFFFGKLFKGPKLTKISPKKTYSGVVGSFVLPLLFGLTYYNYTSLNYSELIKINFILLILIISFTSQLGDLIISYFKRIAKVKDTGKFLPGHGGILDRIDGLIFVIPFIYLIIIF
jgi:phosphatidate cytidylyltransferase